MRAVGRIVLLAVVLVGVFFFWGRWRNTTPWGTGTGYYADKGKSGNSVSSEGQSRLQKVVASPQQYVGKKITLTGRVFQPGRYASNRNIYTLVSNDGQSRVLVIDDKAAPQEYYTRTVNGVLKQVPTTKWLYLVDVKSGVQVDAPTEAQVKTFFTTKYDEARTEVGKALKNVGNQLSG